MRAAARLVAPAARAEDEPPPDTGGGDAGCNASGGGSTLWLALAFGFVALRRRARRR